MFFMRWQHVQLYRFEMFGTLCLCLGVSRCVFVADVTSLDIMELDRSWVVVLQKNTFKKTFSSHDLVIQVDPQSLLWAV